MGIGAMKTRSQRAEYMRKWCAKRSDEITAQLASGEPLTRKCGGCGEIRSLAEFTPTLYWCRPCANKRNKEYRKQHPDQTKANSARNRIKHREKRAQWARAWKQRNRERHAELNRLSAARHSERVRLCNKVAKARRRALAISAQGTASARAIRWRAEMWGNRCWRCGGPYESIDHVKPLARGGSNWAANLRPICKRCNAKKGAIWPNIQGAFLFMDMERLSLDEIRMVSKIIEVLGVPTETDGFGSAIRILDACLAKYRQDLAVLQQASRAHGEG